MWTPVDSVVPPQLQAIANPAAGQNFSLVVPAGQQWRLLGGTFQLRTSAIANTRYVGIEVDTPSGVVFGWDGSDGQAASQTFFYSLLHPVPGNLSGVQNSYYGIELPDFPLLAGWTIKSRVNSMDVGDQLSQILLAVAPYAAASGG